MHQETSSQAQATLQATSRLQLTCNQNLLVPTAVSQLTESQLPASLKNAVQQLAQWNLASKPSVFIAGSGIVGLSLALAHLKAGYNVVVSCPQAPFFPATLATAEQQEQAMTAVQQNPAIATEQATKLSPYATDLAQLDLQYDFDLQYYAVNYYNYRFLKDCGAFNLAQARGYNFYDQLSLNCDGFAPVNFNLDAVNPLDPLVDAVSSLTPSLHNSNSSNAYSNSTTSNMAANKPDCLGIFVENKTMVADLLHSCAQYGDAFLLLDHSFTAQQVSYLLRPEYESRDYSLKEYYELPDTCFMWQLSLSAELQLNIPYVLACDGANSFWRRQAKIPLNSHDYPTSCLMAQVVTNSDTTQAQQHHTWQQLDPNGPKAWLPYTASDGVFVWYDTTQRVAQLQELTAAELTQEIKAQPNISQLLGNDLQVVQHQGFRLRKQKATTYQNQNVLVFGDAAHTVTPIAGQGLNIGLQDVRSYATLLAKASQDSKATLWSHYCAERELDNGLMQEFLHQLHYSYIDQSLLATLKKQALFTLGNINAIKGFTLAYAMGDRRPLQQLLRAKNTIAPMVDNFINFNQNLFSKVKEFVAGDQQTFTDHSTTPNRRHK